MADGDFVVMPGNSVKNFQHLMLRVRKHCGGLKKSLEFVGIADSTYRKLMDDKYVVKSTAQKILNAYARIAPYNQSKAA